MPELNPPRAASFGFIPHLVLTILLGSSLFNGPSLASSARPAIPLAEIKAIISEKSLTPVPAKKLNELTMNELANGLQTIDPYARYLPPGKSVNRTVPNLRVGLELLLYKSKIWVKAEPDGPASQAGLPEVGELRRINDTPVSGNMEEASKLIDEAITGKRLLLDVYQPTENRVRQYNVHPAPYPKTSVSSRRVGNCIFIRVTDFVSRETAPFFSGLYSTLEKSDAKIVVDLRGCPGGDIFEALEIAGMFVPAGNPLLTTYDRAGKLHSYTSPPGKKFRAPDGILMDKSTASAAEVLAGILQKQGLTPLVGERSYGKCASQTIFKLSNGGELWLTTLAIHFADETSCSEIGVQPDILYPDISIARLSNIKGKIEKN